MIFIVLFFQLRYAALFHIWCRGGNSRLQRGGEAILFLLGAIGGEWDLRMGNEKDVLGTGAGPLLSARTHCGWGEGTRWSIAGRYADHNREAYVGESSPEVNVGFRSTNFFFGAAMALYPRRDPDA